jgi:shikimate dehydrogenase
MTPFAEVIGDPIDHSLSPLIHGFWLETLGLPGEYRRRRIARGELESFLAERRSDPDWRGCNVTMPLKLDALAAADRAEDRGLGAGAANILLPRQGELIADNTDVGAAARLLQGLAERGAAMEEVVLLGSGGAARAALLALALLGRRRVRIQSRNGAEAVKLAVQFGLSEQPRPFDYPPHGEGLINATPCGMPGLSELRLDLSGIADKGWVFDFVPAAQPTALLRAASDRGLHVIDGLALLVEQAADSFALMRGQKPPRDADDALMARLRA